eukprot:s1631_g11.t1
MVRESFYHDVLLQWIPQDSDGLLLDCFEKASCICLSVASKALRSCFGHWLVTRYADSISQLEECGFLYCKLFVHHGGLENKITVAKALPGFGSLLWRENLIMSPLDIIAAADTYEVQDVFYRLLEHFPCFMGSVLAELFSRLQGGKDGARPEKPAQEPPAKALAALETVLAKWQTDVRKDYPYRFRRANELVANMICSIPPAEALRCGFAPWFVKLTKGNILDSVTSSTALFLKIQEDCRSHEALCVEFMNILCGASHCGHSPQAVVLMFQACLRVVEDDDCNLGLLAYFGGVQVCQVLSILAKAKSFWREPRSQGRRAFHLRQLLDKAFERHKAILANNESEAADVVEQTCEGRHLRFYPKHGFTHEEQAWISHFETRLFDVAVPKVGCSMRWAGEKAAWNSTFLKGFLRAKTDHFYPEERQEEIEACRKRWVRQWLRGVVAVLQQDSIPVYSGPTEFDDDYATFSDADLEEIQSVCSANPFLKEILEEFADALLELRQEAP